MAHPDDSDSESNSDDEVMIAKAKVRTYSKEKVCKLLDKLFDKCRFQSNQLSVMQEQIEEIAQENILLKSELKATDLVTVTTEVNDEIKRVKNVNKDLSRELERLRLTPRMFPILKMSTLPW